MQTVREHINSMQWAHKGEQKEIHEALENIRRKLVHGTYAFPVHSECTGKAWGKKGNIREREENSYRTCNETHGEWSRKCIKKQGITVKTLAQGTKTIHWEPTGERGDLRMTTWTGSARKPKGNAPRDEWGNVSKEGENICGNLQQMYGKYSCVPTDISWGTGTHSRWW